MPHPLRVLILEDNPSDAELMVHELRRAGFDPAWTRVDTEAAFVAALDGAPEVILADHSLPGFDVFRALHHLRERKLDIPCLVITGTVGDEAAAECIKQGACDYLLKDRLARLGGAVLGALEQRRLGIEKRLAEDALRERSVQLRAMAAELTLAEHRERRRLAEVLHDGIQQLLVGAKLRVQPLDRVADAQVREAGREVAGFLQEALEQTRSLTRELSPPILHAGGLIPALEWLGGWMAEKHGLKVVLGIEGTAGLKLQENLSILLFQSVRELLFNVVKHAKVQTARLEIKEQDGYVHIQVSDEGAGFDTTRPRVEGGTAGGFGLFSIRQRLELLGGHLCIDSAPGQGSRFALSAPLGGVRAAAQPAAFASGRPETSAASADPLPVIQKRIRLLVVDDHTVVRQGLARLLKEEPDMEIVGEAADGETAVDLVRRLLPDVVTMDIRLPGMDGIEATRRIHAECPGVRVVGLSTFEEIEQAKAIRDAGAVDYLTKSGPADALLAAIRAAIDRQA